MSGYVVVLREPRKVFGPFDDGAEAAAFAIYLTAEVDPADVWPLCSPLGDLLGWRQNIAVPVMNAASKQAIP